MYYSAILAVFVLLSITISFIRAIAGKYRVHPFDLISVIFAAAVTFLFIYYKLL